ncbi:hypothetical protein THTE_0059 [Thermogutta terrifontis]|uniref:Uncharacterized protein n=1 Tax=Thermogutta terrifontis TaxID=1331910 RepID=A0A286R9M6_9BACT|nr:hypothetical protein THTE_0059 [Thermogutta terrifontis]
MNCPYRIAVRMMVPRARADPRIPVARGKVGMYQQIAALT